MRIRNALVVPLLLAVVALGQSALGQERKCPGREAEPGTHVVGTEGDDVLDGTSGPDVICGLGGEDLIRAFAGSDVLDGGQGDDRLQGGELHNTIHGGEGNDEIHLRGNARRRVGSNVVFAGAGDDRISAAGTLRARIDCGPGHDFVDVSYNRRARWNSSCEKVRKKYR